MTTFHVEPDKSEVAEVENFSSPSPDSPVAPRSPLLSLKKRREEKKKDLQVDIPVPRWGDDITIVVRYGPIDNEKLDKSLDIRQKQMARGWSIWVNADVLVDSCIGIYALLDGDDTKYSLRPGNETGNWTKFDPDLRENLGLDPVIATSAAHVCRALYRTDGDLILAATKLFEWSGESTERLEEDFTKP